MKLIQQDINLSVPDQNLVEVLDELLSKILMMSVWNLDVAADAPATMPQQVSIMAAEGVNTITTQAFVLEGDYVSFQGYVGINFSTRFLWSHRNASHGISSHV